MQFLAFLVQQDSTGWKRINDVFMQFFARCKKLPIENLKQKNLVSSKGEFGF